MRFLTEEFEDKVIDVVQKATKSVVSVNVGEGNGSGVVISADGFIVTNKHVVAKVEKATVILSDGCALEAKVVGRSNVRDIAILKTTARGLDYLKIAKSEDLKLGQFCIAIGNSLGLGTTVTFGMVSGLNRSIPSQAMVTDGMVQTSAPINPGNSGGALINMKGELIGIPTAMIMFASGVGFAIASDDVKDLFDRLIETGTIRSPQLGMVTRTVDEAVATKMSLPTNRGAVVIKLAKGPAMAAGLQKSDVIVEIDGTAVYSMEDLRKYVVKKRFGERMQIKYIRGAEIHEVGILL